MASNLQTTPIENLDAAATGSGQYWQWRDDQIYYVKAGQNPDLPPLLLVHGFGASTDHWRKNIAELSQEFEVWAIDLLGFGRSAKPNCTYSGELWREQLHDFINQIIQRPAVLAGNSLGGYACLCVAAEYHEAVNGLVLLNSAGPFSDTSPLGAKKVNPAQKIAGKLVQSLLKQPWASYLLFRSLKRKSQIRKTLLQVYVNKDQVTDRLVEDIYRPACDPGAAQVFAAIFTSRQGKTVDELLKTTTCPLLMIWGEGDPWIKAQTRGAKFKQYYPDLTEYYLNSGHCPHDDTPAEVNALIRDWVLADVAIANS
ncbi:alpha/beta hydrolase fold protein [Thalassoporum mexicanum PCC 7367]|uniref:alpha/beta fold hydrolase n=1 Tax=Thalassoporum mexicanum TaxID=3457544 RepID=UPI00029FB835|nr:alpha/beta fold hydrolase [Pseudanabaena sp. PCC 7367]AFY69097.1 alpha/beta hydrolase fold protein [Pseudanabaena sp. PCC 7367]